MPVHLTCSTCETPIVRKPSKVLERNYCSVRCSRSRPPVQPILDIDGLTAHIPLHDRFGNIRAHAIIDVADAAWAGQWAWHLTGKGYAGRIAQVGEERPGNVVLLHRELLGLPQVRVGAIDGDHINRNKLDYRRENLRIAPGTNGQNRSSRSGSSSVYRGVSWHKATGKWAARTTVDGKDRHLGLFTSEQEAAEVARAARLQFQPYAVD